MKNKNKIGIIGFGDMGKLFANVWSKENEILVCDLPKKFETLKKENTNPSIKVVENGREISESCDFILYCVETSNIESVVKEIGPYTKSGAIVSGQCSVKTPEIQSFEKYLPSDVSILGSHALFGPNVVPKNHKMVYFKHRGTVEKGISLLEQIGAELIELPTYEAHDKMMADVQVITHIAFESIGTSFMHRNKYPWENPVSPNGLDNLKLLLTLRIFSYKAHVYEGLALANPFAKTEVRTYAMVENELFGLMISERENDLYRVVMRAKEKVFGDQKRDLMFDEKFMSQYPIHKEVNHKPNSHLSLISMVVTWSLLGINPYNNLLCQTPPFKIRVGLAEYLFMNEELLNESLQTGLYDKSIRLDDLAFHTAVHEWANIIEKGDKNAYYMHFEQTKEFLKDRLEEGRENSNKLISHLK